MASHVAQTTKQASRETNVLLYASALNFNRHLEIMSEFADQVFSFYNMQGAGGVSRNRRISGGLASPISWEAFA